MQANEIWRNQWCQTIYHILTSQVLRYLIRRRDTKANALECKPTKYDVISDVKLFTTF